MSGNILLGGAGNTAAKDFGEQDATITEARIEASKKFTMTLKDGRVVPKIDLLVSFKGDDGKTVRCGYGGIYDAGNGDYSFGKGGKARSLLTRWSEATGRTPQNVSDLIGSRVRVAPKDTEFQGKTSWKLAIIGAAKNPNAPNPPAYSAPTPEVGLFTPSPVAGTPLNGSELWVKIPDVFQAQIVTALKTGSVQPAQLVSSINQFTPLKTEAEANAAINYAKTLNG